MKKFILSIGILIAVFYSYSQTGTYTVSLKYSICPTSPITYIYSAIITDPTGNTTLQVLPDATLDELNYSTQWNLIMSNITNQGYQVITGQVHPQGTDLNGCSIIYWQYLFSPCCAP